LALGICGNLLIFRRAIAALRWLSACFPWGLACAVRL
jgi:hypothetical protein